MTEVNRKENESFDAMLRRFNKEVQLSGRVIEVKKRRYCEKKPNALKQKRNAIRNRIVTDQIEYLVKIGKFGHGMIDQTTKKKMLKIPKVKNK